MSEVVDISDSFFMVIHFLQTIWGLFLICLIVDILYLLWLQVWHELLEHEWEWDYLEDCRFPAHHNVKSARWCYIVVFDLMILFFGGLTLITFLNGAWRW